MPTAASAQPAHGTLQLRWFDNSGRPLAAAASQRPPPPGLAAASCRRSLSPLPPVVAASRHWKILKHRPLSSTQPAHKMEGPNLENFPGPPPRASQTSFGKFSKRDPSQVRSLCIKVKALIWKMSQAPLPGPPRPPLEKFSTQSPRKCAACA